MVNPIKAAYRILLSPIYRRLNAIEQTLQSQRAPQPPYNRRHRAIEDLAEYLIVSEVRGDYLEFGVAGGSTFAHACGVFSSHPFFEPMRLFALDSFEGLPEPTGIDAEGGYTSHFHRSQYAYSESQFLANLTDAGADISRVITVRGWFHESLTKEMAAEHRVTKIAAAWIDCDLYESTVPVLKFITPYLETGSVVLFDDWNCFRNQPDYGEQRACREWIEANPAITLHPLFTIGGHGMAFTVERTDHGSTPKGGTEAG